nr:hypothetical protein L203_03340 [Cryptococcus depauperatus CBS 7841]
MSSEMASRSSSRATNVVVSEAENSTFVTDAADGDQPQEFQYSEGQGEEEAQESLSNLPPVDGGWGAWTYLAAATGLETLVWGFANSYGVFLDYYSARFPLNVNMLPIVGTIAVGEMYLLLSPLTLWLAIHPGQRTMTMWAGLVIISASFLGAAFSQSTGGLVATQGVLYGLGGTMLYCPTTVYMFEWWSKRRGFSAGVMFAGTGAGGLGITYTILLGLLIPFIRPRIPVSTHIIVRRQPKIRWSFLRHRPFWLLWAGVLFQGLASFMPGTYLPSYATALSLSPTFGTLSIALMNLARVPGQVILGYLSDTIGPRKLILGISAASALSVFAGWGSAIDQGGLVAFSLTFGAVAGSYSALFPSLAAILYALFSFARGLGSLCSGPLSSLLMSSHTLSGTKGGYGVEGFGALILWTGAGMVASGVGAGYKGFKVD